jgi:AraC-like DNA-binding protein
MSRLASHTIRARALQSILEYSAQEGVDGQQLRTRLHLEDGDGGDPDRPLPLALTDAAWVWATRLGPPDFMLRAAMVADARAFGLVTYLVSASETVGVALQRLARYYGVLSSGTRHVVRPDAITIELAHAHRRDAVIESFAVAVVASFLRRETDGAWRPARVELRQAAPSIALARAHEHALGAPVVFGSSCNAIAFSPASAALPMRGADPDLARILETHAHEILRRDEQQAAQLRERVAGCLLHGTAKAEDVAAKLGLSERSLRRRLAAEGTSFADVVAGQRSHAALHLLADDRLRLPDVADRLGYATAASFGRAFRRWYGVSPRAYMSAVNRLPRC